MKNALGKIEPVSLRDLWSSESDAFTPWLAEPENIGLLARAVNLDLEVCEQESPVGAFRADILCKDRLSGNLVVVENQLEKSNHRHLGQLLTYASGKGAATIIWIAPRFCEEHRAALDWLNSITEERFKFYAVTIEVLRIGKYQAPRFTVAAGPTGGSRPVRNAGPKPAVSESGKKRFKYWQTFLSQLRLVDKTVELPNANSLGNLRFSLQGRDLWITVYAAASLGRIGVFLRGNETFHSVLRRNRQTIQRQLGKPLRWNEAEDGWSIGLARSAHLSDESDWPAQHEWLATRLQKFLRVFKPYAKRNA